MFAKPFRVKSQSKLKSSDKKRLKTSINSFYSNLELDFTSKDDLEQAKIITSSPHENVLHIYILNGQPLFIELRDGQLCPTVYGLWRWPSLLPSFPTWPEVTSKLANGADLMLPGVVVDINNLGPKAYLELSKGSFVAVNTVTNSAAFGIGTTALSSQDMFMAGKRGKAVNLIHCYGDYLWSFGQKSEIPLLGPPQSVAFIYKDKDEFKTSMQEETQDGEREEDHDQSLLQEDGGKMDEGSVGKVNDDLHTKLTQRLEEVTESQGTEVIDNEVLYEQRSDQEVMNDRLEWSFLQAWRTTAKKLDLPVSSTFFYQRHMVPQCQGEPLQVKKSSYKKFSVFLNHMQSLGLIKVDSKKGEDLITYVDQSHDKLRAHQVIRIECSDNDNEVKGSSYEPPSITRMHSVTAAVQTFFTPFGSSKGTALSREEIRSILRQYVEHNELKKGKLIAVDATLGALLKTPMNADISWEAALDQIIALMSPCHRIQLSNGSEVTRKGNVRPITISTAMRSGNKKVTLVKNLEQPFQIDPAEFAHKCQVGVAASASVQTDEAAGATNANRRLVLVQGDQVRFVTKLLLETYKVDRAHIEGGQEGKKGGKKKQQGMSDHQLPSSSAEVVKALVVTDVSDGSVDVVFPNSNDDDASFLLSSSIKRRRRANARSNKAGMYDALRDLISSFDPDQHTVSVQKPLRVATRVEVTKASVDHIRYLRSIVGTQYDREFLLTHLPM